MELGVKGSVFGFVKLNIYNYYLLWLFYVTLLFLLHNKSGNLVIILQKGPFELCVIVWVIFQLVLSSSTRSAYSLVQFLNIVRPILILTT